MSWSLYLINETKKVNIAAGKINEDEFKERANELVTNFDKIVNNEDFLSIDMEKKVSDLTVSDVGVISNVLSACRTLSIGDNIDMAAALLYNRWLSDGDKLRFEVDADLSGSQEL